MDVGEFAFVALDGTVDPELRKESVCAIGKRAVKAKISGKSAATAVGDRTSESELLEPVVLALTPGIKAQSAYEFRFVSYVGGNAVTPVECPGPPLNHAAGDVSVES